MIQLCTVIFSKTSFFQFNFPMAWSVTTLAWGLIEFKSGYETAGEYNEAVDQIMWVTDYFVKCHTAPNEFWGQVGDGNTGSVSTFALKT